MIPISCGTREGAVLTHQGCARRGARPAVPGFCSGGCRHDRLGRHLYGEAGWRYGPHARAGSVGAGTAKQRRAASLSCFRLESHESLLPCPRTPAIALPVPDAGSWETLMPRPPSAIRSRRRASSYGRNPDQKLTVYPGPRSAQSALKCGSRLPVKAASPSWASGPTMR